MIFCVCGEIFRDFFAEKFSRKAKYCDNRVSHKVFKVFNDLNDPNDPNDLKDLKDLNDLKIPNAP